MLKSINDSIYKVEIPFEDIYTCSFLLVKGSDCIIVDSGNCDDDAKKYVIPAISELGLTPRYIVVSHFHGDHSGGVRALREEYPNAVCASFIKGKEGWRSFTDGEVLFGRFQMINLKGHCEESLAVLDLEEKALLSFDCLQLRGISIYGTGLDDIRDYRKTVSRVRDMGLNRIVTSHEYVPYGSQAVGKDVQRYLDGCLEALSDIKEFALLHEGKSHEEIAELYCKEHPDYPTIYWKIVGLVLDEDKN